MITFLKTKMPDPARNPSLYKEPVKEYTGTAALPQAGEWTVSVSFTDGVGENASLAVNGVRAQNIAGWTACNTGKARLGAFLWTAGDADVGKVPVVTLRGLTDDAEVTLLPGKDEAVIEKAKSLRVKPEDLMNIPNPAPGMQLVVAAGDESPYCHADALPRVLETMSELVPKMRSLGFNGFESYVRWDIVEKEKGVFDWSYYDAVIEKASSFGMKWFPLVIGGSAYALPEWYREGEPGFVGFKCLEHGISNNCPTIFYQEKEQQAGYVKKYLHEFGAHYNPQVDKVFGCRLGPSGNYGESQYPASGNWGYKRQPEHMHIGWWANDEHAHVKFAAVMKEKYGTIEALNEAWKGSYASFDEVKCFLPVSTDCFRKRKDFEDWYLDEMTAWCNLWAVWMREGMPDLDIYQSAGGWGYTDCGTDFTDQARGMVPVKGGIRATNEDESYELNFCITRMLSSAARFYGIKFGSEPAGYGTTRSVMARLYNILVNNGSHLFYYYPNITEYDGGSAHWLKYSPLLARRSAPHIEVAALYPDTQSKLFDSCIRYLEGSSFFSQVSPMREALDYDFCSEHMVLDGALSRYKVLMLLGRNHDGDYVEQNVLAEIDKWIQDGGIFILPALQSNNVRGVMSVEGDRSYYLKWSAGNTGKGKVIIIDCLREPLSDYPDAIVETLKSLDCLSDGTKTMLNTEHPRGVYLSALESGDLAAFNNLTVPAKVKLPCGEEKVMAPLSIELWPM